MGSVAQTGAWRVALIVAVLTSTGCYQSRRWGEYHLADGGFDGSMVVDGGDAAVVDVPDAADAEAGAVDASAPIGDDGGDAGPAEGGDGSVDAATPVDSGTPVEDAGSPCVCVSTGPCERAACVDGACERSFVSEGTPCDESGTSICVGHVCVPRGCGDGYREPGPSPVEERCEDGNVLDGDGCTNRCTLESVSPDPSASDAWVSTPTDGARAIGVDGNGATLFVWTRDRLDHGEVLAMRVGPYGAPIDVTPLVLDANVLVSPVAKPTVTGLRGGGWAAAWSATRGDSRDIVVRIVGVDGSVGYEILANRQRLGVQRDPSVAAVDDGFVVGWVSDFETSSDPGAGVYARVFAANGAGENEMPIATTRTGREDGLVLASTGGSWTAAWTTATYASGLVPYVRARRFEGGSPLDFTEVAVAGPHAAQPAISVAADGTAGIAYVDTSTDGYGDLHLALLPSQQSTSPASRPVSVLPAHREVNPAVATLPNGAWLVTWEDGAPASLAYATIPYTSFGPEASTFEEFFSMRGYGDVSLTPISRGVWFALTAFVPSSRFESFTAFFLPVSSSPRVSP